VARFFAPPCIALGLLLVLFLSVAVLLVFIDTVNFISLSSRKKQIINKINNFRAGVSSSATLKDKLKLLLSTKFSL